jgi:hypothetical protein
MKYTIPFSVGHRDGCMEDLVMQNTITDLMESIDMPNT